MLRHLRRFSFFAACLFAFALVVDWALLLVHVCEPYKPYPYYQAYAEDCTPLYVVFIDRSGIIWGLIGHWLEIHHNGVLAVATVFIAWFTYALFSATTKLWEASKEDLIVGNRPWVFTQPWPRTVSCDARGNILFQMQFASYGNAPATVTEVCVQVSADEPKSDEATYDGLVDKTPFNMAPKNSWLHPKAFVTDARRQFVFGYVRYKDQAGRSHISGYCYRLTGNVFMPTESAGGVAWTYFD